MPLYESTVVIDPTLEEAVITERIQKYVDILTQAGATNIKVDRRGVRKLAYNIKGKDGAWRVQADYSFITYEAPGNVVSTLESNLRLDEDVLRFMTIRYDHEPPPSVSLTEASVGDSDEESSEEITEEPSVSESED